VSTRRRRSSRVATVGIALGLGAALLLSACGGPYPQSALDPNSDFAWKLQHLFEGIFFWAVVVFVLVEGALVYTIIRYRARSSADKPRPVHGNTLLEISWTLAPAIVLVIIAVPTIRTIWDVDRPTRDPSALRVEVVGHQWWWEFRYPELGVVTANEMHVPVGRTIDVRMTSADVIHSFWFPRIGGKRDVIPGHENQIWFTVDSTGVFPGQCAEFCGTAHALMKMELVAQTQEEFEAWARYQAGPAVGTPTPVSADSTSADTGAAPPDTLPQAMRAVLKAGEQAFLASGCIGCHTIQGTPAAGVLGPNLTHVGSRRKIAAGILDNTPEEMARWLRNPAAVKPGVLMPNLNLDEDRIRTLVTYLESLK
jgi:cytochrome c oxidase subunit 2